jgi:acyl-CoA reductase-like NAD-dependent aldehyde dehydrogenase
MVGAPQERLTSMAATLSSFEPATGDLLWTGEIGDADREVAAARAAWAGWAARPLAVRIETMRRFANVVRGQKDKLADLIARETGKPLWEAATEVDAVVGKVDISVSAYGERTSQRRFEGALGARVAVRHKPHGVLAVLGPYNFPAHLPNGHIVPALLAGNTVVFKPSEKTPAVGARLVELLHEAGVPEGVARLLTGGPEQGRPSPPIRASTACCSQAPPAPACRSTTSSPMRRRRSSRWSLAATIRSSSGTCRTRSRPRPSWSSPPFSAPGSAARRPVG